LGCVGYRYTDVSLAMRSVLITRFCTHVLTYTHTHTHTHTHMQGLSSRRKDPCQLTVVCVCVYSRYISSYTPSRSSSRYISLYTPSRSSTPTDLALGPDPIHKVFNLRGGIPTYSIFPLCWHTWTDLFHSLLYCVSTYTVTRLIWVGPHQKEDPTLYQCISGLVGMQS
jgi:hypothetical protein